MVEELGPSRDQRIIDDQQLKLLSIFHFIGAGLAGLGIFFVIGHYALFSTMMNNSAAWQGNAPPPPPEFWEIFRWFYVVMGVWLAADLVLNMLAGRYLRARKHRTFCIVVAALNCLHMPLGTILGIFTIVVLARDSIRASFARRSGAPLE